MCMKNGKTLHISCLLREKKGEKLFILSLDAWPECNQFPVSHTRDRFPNVWNVISSSRQWRGSVLSLPHPTRCFTQVGDSIRRTDPTPPVCSHHCVLVSVLTPLSVFWFECDHHTPCMWTETQKMMQLLWLASSRQYHHQSMSTVFTQKFVNGRKKRRKRHKGRHTTPTYL